MVYNMNQDRKVIMTIIYQETNYSKLSSNENVSFIKVI